jgi:hypothetical protein
MLPHRHAISLWTSLPGIRMTTPWGLVAEIGTNPEQFPQGSNLTSWAGKCALATMKAPAGAKAARHAEEIAGFVKL